MKMEEEEIVEFDHRVTQEQFSGTIKVLLI